ncbi:unnamed protein product [Sphenostylis stenocarpa]|uniref:Uncharacterized protein n=1 Tax=Sphenostylis stenocarpa TaxID=92480 RepID=A0AA86T5Q6_9FABA|nr:unnamed protein product [Sphenostylis stenocarpa]
MGRGGKIEVNAYSGAAKEEEDKNSIKGKGCLRLGQLSDVVMETARLVVRRKRTSLGGVRDGWLERERTREEGHAWGNLFDEMPLTTFKILVSKPDADDNG